jgi:hypothetical protein
MSCGDKRILERGRRMRCTDVSEASQDAAKH